MEVHFEHAKRAEINLHHTLPTVTQDWILLDEIENSYERLVALIKGKEAELVLNLDNKEDLYLYRPFIKGRESTDDHFYQFDAYG